MSNFDPQKHDNPRGWREMSFESKLMLVYLGGMLVILEFGDKLTLTSGLFMTSAFVFVLAFVSVRHRMANGWRWPGVTHRNILHAVLTLVLGGLFAVAVNPLFPITNLSVRPWYLGLAGAVLLNVLWALKIIDASKTGIREKYSVISEVQTAQGTQPTIQPNRGWKTTVNWVFSIFFLLVCLVGMASFYSFGVAMQNGSSTPTTFQTESLSVQGRVVYVTPSEKFIVDLLEVGMVVGLLVVFVLGFIFQRFFKIKLLPERRKRPDDEGPTMWDRWETKGKD